MTAPLPAFPTIFIEGDYGEGEYPYTLVELAMLKMKQSVLEKDDWQSKINNKEIVSRWQEECEDQNLSTDGVNHILNELRAAAAEAGGGGAVGGGAAVGDGMIVETGVDRVFFARNWVSGELRARLLSHLPELEENARKVGSWHPGSNDQVLDIVHPSMYCLVDKFTVTDIGGGGGGAASETSPKESGAGAGGAGGGGGSSAALDSEPQTWQSILTKVGQSAKPRSSENITLQDVLATTKKPTAPNDFASHTFQWLPAEFHVNAETGRTAIWSYINNLHPGKHEPIYETIASVFDCFVPLFERVLAAITTERPQRIRVDPYGWYDEHQGDSEDDDERDNYHVTRLPRPVQIPPFPGGNPRHVEPLSLKGRSLQVIVKIASIELTPEKPTYPGGTWHVEATQRESIVATGIYYIESHNISNSRLGFRIACREPDYEQSDDRGVKAVFGLENEGALNQDLGSVATTGGTCLAFPNVLQHRVHPFHLDNPTQNGHRKILVFFLIDPNRRITSTSTVLPQQRDWYEDSGSEPIQRLLSTHPSWPMSRDEAKEAMHALMEERANIVTHHNETLFEREFSLCEH